MIWSASLVSHVGHWFMTTGRAFLVYEITGSAAALGTLYFFSLIPMLIFPPLGGTLADRFDRRSLLVACQVALTVTSLAIGLLAQLDLANLVNVSLFAFLYGVAMGIQSPVQQSLIPALVPRADLTSAVSIFATANSGARIVGPLLAAALLPLVGLHWLFYLNAISFGFVIAAWAATKVPPVVQRARIGTLRASIGGIGYARDHPAILLPLVAAGVVGGVGLSYSPQIASFASIYLADGDEHDAARYYGLMQGALGLGSVIGVITLPRLGRRHPAAALLVGVFGFGAGLTLLGLVPTPATSLLVSVLLGGLQFATGAHAMSLIQHHVDEEFRGRMAGLYTISFVGLFPLFGLIAGFLSEPFGVAPVFAGTGMLCVLLGIPLLARRRFISMPPPGQAPASVRG